MLSLVAIASICLVDLLTGPDVGFSLFYLIPVVVTAWYVGRGPGLILAVAGALAWLFADTVNRGTVTLGVSVWNGFTRLVIFIAIALLLDRQRTSAARLAVVDRQREEFLRVLDYELPRPVEAIASLAQKLDRSTPEHSDSRGTVHELQERSDISEKQKQRVEKYIALGQEEGGTIAFQGDIPTDPDLAAGHWVAPLIFTDISNDMRIAREEIFGPVLATIRFDSIIRHPSLYLTATLAEVAHTSAPPHC